MPIRPTGKGLMPAELGSTKRQDAQSLKGTCAASDAQLADLLWPWYRMPSGRWVSGGANVDSFLGRPVPVGCEWATLAAWFSPQQVEATEALKRAVFEGEATVVELRMRDASDGEHWVRVAAVPVGDRPTSNVTLAFVVVGPSSLARFAERERNLLLGVDLEKETAAITRALATLRTCSGREVHLSLGTPLFGWKQALQAAGVSVVPEAGSGTQAPSTFRVEFAGEKLATLCFAGGVNWRDWPPHLQRVAEFALHDLAQSLSKLAWARASQITERLARLLAATRQTFSLLEIRGNPLRELCRVVAQEFGADSAFLWFAGEPEAPYSLVAHWGLTDEEVEGLRVLEVPREVLAQSEAWTFRTLPQGTLAEILLGRDEGAVNAALRVDPGAVLVLQWRAADHVPEVAPAFADAASAVASVWFMLSRLTVELDRAVRLKSDFVATMSHELRTPLNTLIGYTDLLACEEFGPLTEEQRDVLDRMAHSARELLNLINATLDLGRFENQGVAVNLEDVTLADVVAEVDQETAYQRRRRGLQFAVQIDPEVRELRTDRGKLKVILKNLIANAVKFTERGGVEVVAAAVDNGVEIAVRDTGIGIDPAILPIIFEPFRQGEPATTRRFGGIGLGLYIVRRLVEALGGRVGVESHPGKGSVFRVWLPFTPSRGYHQS